MIFNQHPQLVGKHAFLSPSSYSWLNYDSHKLEARFHSAMAARRGTDLHALAHEAVRLGVNYLVQTKHFQPTSTTPSDTRW